MAVTKGVGMEAENVEAEMYLRWNEARCMYGESRSDERDGYVLECVPRMMLTVGGIDSIRGAKVARTLRKGLCYRLAY